MSKPKQHKKQHYVASSYLDAWADPECPEHQEPFVWLFDRDGKKGKAKAPKNIFHETDMYTITGPNGERDLYLEHGLSELESEFARLRREKLALGEPLDEMEHFLVCAFIAAAHERTKVRRMHWRSQWEPVLKIMNELEERMKNATKEQKRSMDRMPTLSSGPSLSHEHVKQIVEEPLQTLLHPAICALAPHLVELDLYIIETDDELGFITSDHPCVWYDPEGYKRPPMYRNPALMYHSIEISLPISPRQCILLNRLGMNGCGKALNAAPVQTLNKRTRAFAGENFIVCRNRIDPAWFTADEEPEDSWEKVQARRNAMGE